MKRGFTIVELLVVIAIIGVLLGIVSVAANGAIRNGRTKRATAMCNVLQQAIATYYSKRGEWPKTIEDKIDQMGSNNKTATTYNFTPEEADKIFQEIVRASVGANATMPLVDASALFVANASTLKNNKEGCYDNHAESSLKTFCGNKKCANGVDFSIASKKGKGHIPLSDMAFGYQATNSGKFSRFWITYNLRTDAVTVSRKNPDYEKDDQYPKEWD